MNPRLEKVLSRIRDAQLIQFAGVDLNGPNVRSPIFGETPLQHCSYLGDTESARVLLDAGAQIDVSGEEDCTALHEAIMQGQGEMERFLVLRGADLKRESRFGDAFETADRSESEEIRNILKSSPSSRQS